MQQLTPAEAWVLRSLLTLHRQGSIATVFTQESLPAADKRTIKQKVLKSLVAKGWLSTEHASSGAGSHSFFPYETDPFQRYLLTPAALAYAQDSVPEPEDAGSDAPALPRTQLHQLLQHCSESELHDLCFELGIDHEQFSPKKHDLVRELITYVEQANQLQDLNTVLERLRPELYSDGSRL